MEPGRMMPPSDLAEWRKIAEAATPGPWELQDGCSWRRIGTRGHDGNVLCPINHPADHHPDLQAGRGEDTYANLLHIITFNPATVLALLDALDEREAEIDDIRAMLDAERDRADRIHDGLEARAEAAEAELTKALAENTKLGAELNSAYRLASLSSSADEVQALAEAVKERDDMAGNAADWCDRADEAYGRIDALSTLLRKAGEGLDPFAEACAHLHPSQPDSGVTLDGFRVADFRCAAALAQEIRRALREPAAAGG